MRALVTGASGWIARALCAALSSAGHSVTGLTRSEGVLPAPATSWLHPADHFAGINDAWASREFDVVFHLAGRAHVMREHSDDPSAAYHEANVEGSRRVAEAARAHGIKRLIYLSSVKALGDAEPQRAWREDDAPGIQDAYGRSKWDAERALLSMDSTGFETVVLRVPLVYGPGVRANFERLMASIARHQPLPLALATAPRSLIARDNVVSALMACAAQPRAAGRVLHATDADDLSVADLIRAIARALEVRALLLPVPKTVLRALAHAMGKSAVIERLVDPLRLDTRVSRELLQWAPQVTTGAALRQTALAWRAQQQ